MALVWVSSSLLSLSSSSSSSSSKPSLQVRTRASIHHFPCRNTLKNAGFSVFSSWVLKNNRHDMRCRAEKEYKFPDPIPEFAEAETKKFRTHLTEKLLKKDMFGDSVDEVVEICTKILNEFLHSEYGGPGTLLVVPFIDMADTLNERGLPGGPQAARAAVKWAQKHVDNDWKQWNAAS